MNRRQFLCYSAFYGFSITLGNPFTSPQSPRVHASNDKNLLEGIRIIDAHAHPDRLVPYGRTSAWLDNSSTLKAIKNLGMVASSFAAVGDQANYNPGGLSGTELESTMAQLEWWVKRLVEPGEVKLILKASDVPTAIDAGRLPGAILAIEGGDPLKGSPDRVNEFYRFGVRMITLVHYRNNELGDIMKSWRNKNPGPFHHGLTRAGQRVIERMEDLGMVVDVAHAHSITLKQIAEVSRKPLVDSHTSLCSVGDPLKCGRLRTWKDMELVAKTGGVVCTWPLAYQRGNIVRKTFLNWTREILEMKKRLGMEHVGLGTDGGGHISKFIDGYRDVSDLVHLVAAMQEVGFLFDEIKAYMGGNFYRVLRSCIG